MLQVIIMRLGLEKISDMLQYTVYQNGYEFSAITLQEPFRLGVLHLKGLENLSTVKK